MTTMTKKILAFLVALYFDCCYICKSKWNAQNVLGTKDEVNKCTAASTRKQQQRTTVKWKSQQKNAEKLERIQVST